MQLVDDLLGHQAVLCFQRLGIYICMPIHPVVVDGPRPVLQVHSPLGGRPCLDGGHGIPHERATVTPAIPPSWGGGWMGGRVVRARRRAHVVGDCGWVVRGGV